MSSLRWVPFVVLLFSLSYLSLRACGIEFSSIGISLKRCPTVFAKENLDQSSQYDHLLGELSSLRTAIALTPTCEVATLPDLPPTIEPPPPIKKSEEIAFILDTSGSMKSGSLANGLKPRDIALPLLQNAFGSMAQQQPMSLWRYDDCDTNPVRVAGPGESNIEQKLLNLQFDNSSATARAILNIPKMIPRGAGESAERPMNVILISDGNDGCSGNNAPAEIRNRPDIDAQGGRICVAARRIARQLPHLAIHVVALDESLKTAMACVKDATNGWFIESTDPDALRVAVDYISSGGSQATNK